MSRRRLLVLLLLAACGGPDVEAIREGDLAGAHDALQLNLAAIHRRDAEMYLAQYLDSPEFTVVEGDSLRRGFLLFAEARRASGDWPDTLIAERPELAWLGPGVVWAGFGYTRVQGGDTVRGVSERLFVKTGGGWKIKVTGNSERCGC